MGSTVLVGEWLVKVRFANCDQEEENEMERKTREAKKGVGESKSICLHCGNGKIKMCSSLNSRNLSSCRVLEWAIESLHISGGSRLAGWLSLRLKAACAFPHLLEIERMCIFWSTHVDR